VRPRLRKATAGKATAAPLLADLLLISADNP
jgi:hypothetical protein